LRLIEIHKKGRGVKRDLKRANTYLHHACSAAHYPSCFALGNEAKERKELGVARHFFYQACRGGFKKACALMKELPKPKDSKVIQPRELPKLPAPRPK